MIATNILNVLVAIIFDSNNKIEVLIKNFSEFSSVVFVII